MPTPLSWSLYPDPTSPSATPEETATQQAAEAAAAGLPTFLGRGLLRPFRRDKKTDFASASGISLVAACLGQVLGTKADTPQAPGELPWRTDFGSRLHILRHRNNSDALNDLATVIAQEAVARWEPRIRLLRVSVEKNLNPRELLLRIRFNVVDRGGRTVQSNQETTVSVAASSG